MNIEGMKNEKLLKQKIYKRNYSLFISNATSIFIIH